MGVLQLLAADETTVLWDFADTTGGANPGGVATQLAAALDLGTLETNLNIFRTGEPGGQKLGVSDPPVEFTVQFMASATTYDQLVTGLGQLARWLRDPPGPLKWTQGSLPRYMELLGSPVLPALMRGQGLAGIVAARKSSLGPIPVTMLRQPWMRTAPETEGPTNVPNDPASGTPDLCRVFPITVLGDLPTPAAIKATMDAGSAVERVTIAHRSQGGEASAVMADYLSDTAFAQCEASGRGWTVTLGTDTTTATEATASPGTGVSVADTSFNTLAHMLERVKLTRTTKMDSLRGSWDVWVRVKAAFQAVLTIQLRWAPAATGQAMFSNDEVEHDTETGDPAVLGWVELNLGTIHIPEGVDLGGLQLGLWASSSATSMTLRWDHIWLTPHAHRGTVLVPGGSYQSWLGRDLLTPVANAGGPLGGAGSAGAVSGTSLLLNSANDNAGTPPNTGTILPAGRYRVTWTIRNAVQPSIGTDQLALIVRNITGSTNNVLIQAVPPQGVTKYRSFFDANGTSAYQIQVDDPIPTPFYRVDKIELTYLPSLGNNESLRTEPGSRYSVDRLDSSGNLAGYLGIEGEIPAVLEPGLNHIMIRSDEIPRQGYEENDNQLTRSPAVTVIYSPRYAL